MTFTQQEIRSAQASRAIFALVAVIFAALALMHLADGARALGALSAFPAALFAASALVATHRIRIMKRMVAYDEFRERMVMMPSPAPSPPAPRSAWDVSMTLDPAAAWNEVVHYEDASRKPDGIATGVIRVIPRTARHSAWTPRQPVVTSWTVVTRAPSHGEGIDLLKAAEPLLRDVPLNRYRPEARYFRFTGGTLAEVLGCLAPPGAEADERLAAAVPTASMQDVALGFARLSATLGPCAHPAAEPVDLLVTGERVAWICPDCEAKLPADWN